MPVDGLPSGPCPGYWKDHIVPLACGGPDIPSNMQWQTIADARAKDAWELDRPNALLGICPGRNSPETIARSNIAGILKSNPIDLDRRRSAGRLI